MGFPTAARARWRYPVIEIRSASSSASTTYTRLSCCHAAPLMGSRHARQSPRAPAHPGVVSIVTRSAASACASADATSAGGSAAKPYVSGMPDVATATWAQLLDDALAAQDLNEELDLRLEERNTLCQHRGRELFPDIVQPLTRQSTVRSISSSPANAPPRSSLGVLQHDQRLEPSHRSPGTARPTGVAGQ
jgi:hypothetical protein